MSEGSNHSPAWPVPRGQLEPRKWGSPAPNHTKPRRLQGKGHRGSAWHGVVVVLTVAAAWGGTMGAAQGPSEGLGVRRRWWSCAPLPQLITLSGSAQMVTSSGTKGNILTAYLAGALAVMVAIHTAGGVSGEAGVPALLRGLCSALPTLTPLAPGCCRLWILQAPSSQLLFPALLQGLT